MDLTAPALRAVPGARIWAAALAALLILMALDAGTADAALLNRVYSNTVTLPNSASATNVALTGVDITRAFVVCSMRAPTSTVSQALYSCDLNNGGPGGAARLTITPAAAPGTTTAAVHYYVAEFLAGVSVQRGTATFNGTSLTPSATPSLSAVDCTKSFLLTSVRSTDASANADERWMIRATLGSAATPCTTGTTTSLELTRLEGSNGTTVTVPWQVITYEGASVQRGTSCIGGSGASPACPTASGATNGLNNRITLGTGVDTTKSFVLFTAQGGTALAGVEGEHLVRAQFLATGASVTGVQFVRALTATTNNHQVQISWEVVALNDGTTVQSSGTGTASITAGNTTTSPNITTVDTTRTVAFFSASGGSAGTNTLINDVMSTGAIAGSNAGTQSEVIFTRIDSTVANNIAWFAVSFFRCTTPSGVAHDTLCTLGVSTTGTQATVHWSSVNPVLIVAGIAPVTFTPTNGTTYTAGQVFGGDTVAYSGTVATDTSYTGTGLSIDTTYYFTVWAKAGTAGSCNTPPCYVASASGNVTPRANTAWSSVVVGGAALNPAVAGTARLSFGSNAGKLVSVDSATGQWTGVPGNTVSPVQGYVTVFSYSGGEAVIGGDQSGWVYSINQATGAYHWIRKLNADAIQAPLSLYSRELFGANAGMATAYPGSYDVIFAATANNTGSGGFTNNKVFALRSDTGAVLWTFSPATLAVAPCATGCPMDQVVGQPWVDIERARLYVTSGSGSGGTQNSIWVLDLLNSGALLARFAGGDITSAPSQSFDLASLFVGNEAGVLNIVNLNALTLTQNNVAAGLVFKGFIWEDLNESLAGRLYFVTTDGFVRALATPTSGSFAWSTRPVAGGTVAQLLPGFTSLWVGGSNGRLYQLNLTTGAQEGSAFVVGSGSLSLGPVSTETGDELYVAASDGTVYKTTLSGGSLP
jgi:hypothetical protein